MKTQILLDQAVARHRAGDLDAAEALYRKVLRREPGQALVLNELGNIALQQQRPADAAAWFGKAIAHARSNAGYAFNLAIAQARAGRHAEALAALDKALALAPDNHGWRREAITFAAQIGDIGRATGHLAALLAAGQADANLLHSMAELVARSGRAPMALDLARQAVVLAPSSRAVAMVAALLLALQGPVAQPWLERALRLDPLDAGSLVNRASIAVLGQYTKPALDDLRAVVAISPAMTDAYINLGTLHHRLGDLAPAIAYITRALQLEPANQDFQRQALLFKTEIAASDSDDVARALASRFRADMPAPALVARRGDRLRIGYVSPDFRVHSCAWFLMPLYECHDRKTVDVISYSGVATPDTITSWFRDRSDLWRETLATDDIALARQVREDAVDVLVDLAGLTLGHRSGLFRQKPAATQVTWLGYNGTTANPAIDWKIVDSWLAPPDREIDWFAERLWRLPRLSHCWRPPQSAPDVVLPGNRAVVFGSFNNLSKVSPSTIATWAEILSRVAGSRLLLKGPTGDDPFVQHRLQVAFAAHGIAADRISVLGRLPQPADHLQLYGEIDIGLDPYPYNGTTTTCEALWMGLPIVTLAGNRLLGRVGASLMTAIGLDDLVAQTREAYVEIAVALAADPARRQELRRGLRDRVIGSALRDEAGFAAAMEASFVAMLQGD